MCIINININIYVLCTKMKDIYMYTCKPHSTRDIRTIFNFRWVENIKKGEHCHINANSLSLSKEYNSIFTAAELY